MKTKFIFIILLLFIFGCEEDQKIEDQKIEDQNTQEYDIRSFIEGNKWVTTDAKCYYSSGTQLECTESFSGITSFSFDDDTFYKLSRCNGINYYIENSKSCTILSTYFDSNDNGVLIYSCNGRLAYYLANFQSNTLAVKLLNDGALSLEVGLQLFDESNCTD